MFEGQTKIGLFFWYVSFGPNSLFFFFFFSCFIDIIFCPAFLCDCLRPKITRLDFKKSKLTLVVVEDDDQVITSAHTRCTHDGQQTVENTE